MVVFFILLHSFNFVWACPGLNSILGHEFMALIILGCPTLYVNAGALAHKQMAQLI